ncbi:prephenate dehydratase [Planococcus maritimus]|uniref:prephenate dehydratase n=1 Tax=Planococcus maritimus TaxID=192421 RepID=UPI0007931598|nr:prephenate dehydratase [Planococcus maritimus]ANU16952.1 prephenate dehydratase [Planococcus maritimus]KYG58067.1 prephenate dehydratase [Planococcus maritimus]OED32185.1 prephenate dehydratase [Planococcus maritimus]
MTREKKRISFLGPEASFTHLAASKVFPTEQLMPYTTIPECIEAVADGTVDYAVVPLENALEGSVPLTVDYLFHEAELYVTAEVLSPIEQHLLVHPENRGAESFEAIYSHPHALAQCHKYLFYTYKHTPLEQYSSTAAAAKMVAELPERNIAAIANDYAAEKYGLDIVQRDIHDFHFNHTRFFVLSRSNHKLTDPGHEAQIKTTLMITPPKDDRSGVLHQVLSVFAWRQLNLSKIESRPLKTGLGNYFFIADVLEDENAAMMRGAFEELTALGCGVKTLGSYYTYNS